MTSRDIIRPQRKCLVFDLAEEAGFDVSDWVTSSNSSTSFKSNPKYCYNWSFLTPGRVLILNLWFDTIQQDAAGTLICAENYRLDASQLRAQGGKAKWIERGLALDAQLQVAARDALPIRVIVNDGTRRVRGDPSAGASSVTFRDLDPEPWHIRAYDHETGAFVLARGGATGPLVDQFETNGEPVGQTQSVGLRFVRDPAVRRGALARSGGRCELCGTEGFEMESGSRYLETHHIIPLAEGGPDTLANVIALCPNDHRRAHYEIGRAALRTKLAARIVK